MAHFLDRSTKGSAARAEIGKVANPGLCTLLVRKRYIVRTIETLLWRLWSLLLSSPHDLPIDSWALAHPPIKVRNFYACTKILHADPFPQKEIRAPGKW